jgi:hypothetical protein
MGFFSRLSPIRAFLDLRRYLQGRPPYELGFLLLAMAMTTGFIFVFARDSGTPAEYQPDIIYVEQYRLDRTDAEIAAQQKIDGAIKAKRVAEIEKRAAERRASFKRLDDKLRNAGF